jgi:hypothetical protein
MARNMMIITDNEMLGINIVEESCKTSGKEFNIFYGSDFIEDLSE